MTGVKSVRAYNAYNQDTDVDPERTATCAAAVIAAGVPERYVHRLGDGAVGVNSIPVEFFLTVRLGRDGDWTYRGAWGPVARANDIVCASAAEAVERARYHGYLDPVELASEEIPP